MSRHGIDKLEGEYCSGSDVGGGGYINQLRHLKSHGSWMERDGR